MSRGSRTGGSYPASHALTLARSTPGPGVLDGQRRPLLEAAPPLRLAHLDPEAQETPAARAPSTARDGIVERGGPPAPPLVVRATLAARRGEASRPTDAGAAAYPSTSMGQRAPASWPTGSPW